jgi:hypothetical protein
MGAPAIGAFQIYGIAELPYFSCTVYNYLVELSLNPLLTAA